MSEVQLHVGRRRGGPSCIGSNSIWHSMTENGVLKYWSGDWGHRTPRELLGEAVTTIADLLRNHPELIDEMRGLPVPQVGGTHPC